MDEIQVDSLPRDEAVWAEEMDKVEGSSTGLAKKIFLIAKTSFIVFQTVKAAIAWKRSKKPMGIPALLLLLFSALIVVLVCAYKFKTKLIAPLVGL